MRQKKGRIAGAATLRLIPPEQVRVPPLPRRPERSPQWTERAREWWRQIWASPMTSEWLESDQGRLLLLAELFDMFWREKETSRRIAIAAEIRLQCAEFGLGPLSRRRLQWEVARGEEAQRKTERRRPRDATDPRLTLSEQ